VQQELPGPGEIVGEADTARFNNAGKGKYNITVALPAVPAIFVNADRFRASFVTSLFWFTS
jgi:hypothetical protein